jgi:hypothetical protein
VTFVVQEGEASPSPSNCEDYIDISPSASTVDVILPTSVTDLPCSDCFDLKAATNQITFSLKSEGDQQVDSANTLLIADNFGFCDS